MRTAAILPVKRFAAAKSRLGFSRLTDTLRVPDSLATDALRVPNSLHATDALRVTDPVRVADPLGVTDLLRADLARAMVGDVLVALREVKALESTIVVTSEEPVVAAALYLDALVVPDTSEAGQNAAVALGVERALAEGFERVLCVPGDCPALDPAELDALLETPRARGDLGVAIVPDRHGTGTNGLLLTPPDAIAPSFGPGSCERHRALAHAAGADCRIERPASLLLDVDTGADLTALRELLGGEHVRAPRTRAVLGLSTRAGAHSITAGGAVARSAAASSAAPGSTRAHGAGCG